MSRWLPATLVGTFALVSGCDQQAAPDVAQAEAQTEAAVQPYIQPQPETIALISAADETEVEADTSWDKIFEAAVEGAPRQFDLEGKRVQQFAGGYVVEYDFKENTLHIIDPAHARVVFEADISDGGTPLSSQAEGAIFWSEGMLCQKIKWSVIDSLPHKVDLEDIEGLKLGVLDTSVAGRGCSAGEIKPYTLKKKGVAPAP